MLEEARKRFQDANGNIDIRLGEIEHLPLSDAEADLAVISLVLQYLAKPEAAIAEVSRALKAGGLFIVADFEKHDNSALRDTYGARWLGFSRKEVEKWLTANGFSLQRTDSYELAAGLPLNIYHAVKN